MTDYENRTYVVTEIEDLNQFVPLEHPRPLRPGKIRRFKESILKDGGIKEPITVNLVGGRRRVIDGWHRVTATRELFLEGLLQVLVIPGREARGMSKEQELHEYDVINSIVTPQAANDFLVSHQDEIPIIKELVERKVPFKENPTDDGFALSSLIDGYAKRQAIHTGGGSGDILKRAKEMGPSDAEEIARFSRIFEEAFGGVRREDIVTRGVILFALWKVYGQNRNRVPEEAMIRRFRKCSSDKKLQRFVSTGGRKGVESATYRIRNLMNKNEKIKFSAPPKTKKPERIVGEFQVSTEDNPFSEPPIEEKRKAGLAK